MTYSNSSFSANPLANPFNTRIYGNFNVNAAQTNQYVSFPKDKSNLHVPDAVMPNLIGADQLHTPNQDVPLGNRNVGNGFLNKNLFRCADGTVLDLQNHRVIDPNLKYKQSGFWNDPNSRQQDYDNSRQADWNDKQINRLPGTNDLGIDPGLSRKDIEYNNYVNRMNQQLSNEMTEYQKKMLSSLEAAGFFDSNLQEVQDE